MTPPVPTSTAYTPEVIDLTQGDDPPALLFSATGHNHRPSAAHPRPSQLSSALRQASLLEHGFAASQPKPPSTSRRQQRLAARGRRRAGAALLRGQRQLAMGENGIGLKELSAEPAERALGGAVSGPSQGSMQIKVNGLAVGPKELLDVTNGASPGIVGQSTSQVRTQPSHRTQTSHRGILSQRQSQASPGGSQLSQGWIQSSQGGMQLSQTRLKPNGKGVTLEKDDISTWRPTARLPTTTICKTHALECYKLTGTDLRSLEPRIVTREDNGTMHLYSAIEVEHVAWAKYGGPDAFEKMLDGKQKEWEKRKRRSPFRRPVWRMRNGVEVLEW